MVALLVVIRVPAGQQVQGAFECEPGSAVQARRNWLGRAASARSTEAGLLGLAVLAVRNRVER